MEDIIYILIGIAWIGFSLYNSQRKLKQKQEKARQARQASDEKTSKYDEPSKPRSFIDSLLAEFEEKASPKETIYETQPTPQEEPDSFKEIVRKKREADYHSIQSVENYESIENVVEDNSILSTNYFDRNKETKDKKQKDDKVKSKNFEAEFVENQISEDEHDFDFDFDLRQAIIYSEILNKPKYLESIGT